MSQFIDLSNNTPGVDLRAVKAEGYEGVYCKASQGTGFTDSTYPTYRQAARDAGLLFGAYHFADVAQTGPHTEAAHFLQVAQPKAGDMVPVLDAENGSANGATAWIQAFLGAVEKAIGCPPGVYTGQWWWKPNVATAAGWNRFPLWVSGYGVAEPPMPEGWVRYTAWQFTDRQPVAGHSIDASHGIMPLIDGKPPAHAPQPWLGKPVPHWWRGRTIDIGYPAGGDTDKVIRPRIGFTRHLGKPWTAEDRQAVRAWQFRHGWTDADTGTTAPDGRVTVFVARVLGE